MLVEKVLAPFFYHDEELKLDEDARERILEEAASCAAVAKAC